MKHGFVVAAVLLGAACGDNSAGTVDPDAMPAGPDAAATDTTAPTTTASPPGGVGFDVPQAVTLTADEAATIYYTTDGTTPTTASPSGASPLEVTGITAGQPLQFFAVDAAGNTEAVKSEAYTLDRGYTISIADPTSNPVVTITKQPVGMTLSASNAAIVVALGGLTQITFDLTVTSGVDRRVFNLKTTIGSASDGEVTTDATLPGGDPFRYFGPGALVPGGAVTRSMQVSGVTGAANPLVIDGELADAPMLYGGDDYNGGISAVDTSWSGVETQLDASTLTYGGNAGSINDAVITADQATVYLSSRNLPSLIAIDTETFEGTLSPSLSTLANSPNGVGCTGGLAMSPDEQYLYTVLLDGNHMYGSGDADGDGADNITIELVRIDRATLAEVDRVTLMTAVDVNNNDYRVRSLALSPDGTTAVIPIKGARKAAVVDVTTMTVLDADAVTAGTQLVDLADAVDLDRDFRTAAIAADGSTAYLPAWRGAGDALVELDLATFTTTTRVLDAAASNSKSTEAQLGPDGKLYVARRDGDLTAGGLLIIDLTTGAQTTMFPALTVAAVAFTSDGAQGIANTSDGLYVFDVATGDLVDLDFDAGNGVTSALSDVRDAHQLVVTRY